MHINIIIIYIIYIRVAMRSVPMAKWPGCTSGLLYSIRGRDETGSL